MAVSSIGLSAPKVCLKSPGPRKSRVMQHAGGRYLDKSRGYGLYESNSSGMPNVLYRFGYGVPAESTDYWGV